MAVVSSATASAAASPRRLAFLLRGKVQGVKMRRYVEAAGKYYKVGGYVINTESGDVFGEAWDTTGDSLCGGFEIWIRGQQSPLVYTNIKPTPIGTAYPELARVDRYATSISKQNRDDDDNNSILQKYFHQFTEFTMVRDDEEAADILKHRNEIEQQLSKALLESTSISETRKEGESFSTAQQQQIDIGSWPPKR